MNRESLEAPVSSAQVHTLSLSIAFLFSAAGLEYGLGESWVGDGGLRNGLETFSLTPVHLPSMGVGWWGLLLAPACCWPGGRKKQKTFASAGRAVRVIRRKDQVNSRREVRGALGRRSPSTFYCTLCPEDHLEADHRPSRTPNRHANGHELMFTCANSRPLSFALMVSH